MTVRKTGGWGRENETDEQRQIQRNKERKLQFLNSDSAAWPDHIREAHREVPPPPQKKKKEVRLGRRQTGRMEEMVATRRLQQNQH